MIPRFRLLAISDLASPASPPLESWLRSLRQFPGEIAVQLREKHFANCDRDLLALARRARGIFPGILLINGRLDLALAAGADGVHLPADGVPAGPLRRRFGTEVLLGRSTHRPEEVEQARRDGVDYVTFGPIFPTPGKEAWGPPPGLAGLREAVAAAAGDLGELAVFALGGIELVHFPALAAAGATGAAGIRLFQSGDLDRFGALARAAAEIFGSS